MRRYAIKLHLVSLIGSYFGRSCAQVRRYADTQAGTSYEREVPRSARPINSICPKRLRILPDGLPCHISLSLSIKGSSYHHTNHYCPTFKQSQTSERPWEEHILGIPLIYLVYTSRLVHDAWHHQAVRCDAIRYDVMLGGKRGQQQRQQPQVEAARCAMFPPSCVPSCPIVCSQYLSCLAVQRRRTPLLPLPIAHAKPCHAIPWVRGKWEFSARSFTPSSLLDEANCPSGIVYRADGSRLLPGPPMHPHPHPRPSHCGSQVQRPGYDVL